MRADYYGHCAAYPQLAKPVGSNQILVGPLAHAELVSVIEHPAQRVGLRVEPGLTEELLSDLGDEPGTLPLLSTALLELWQAREAGRLTLAAYRGSGGVQGAVARLAERAFANLSDVEREIARSIFLRLAGSGEGEGVVRRRVPLSEFDQSDERVAIVLTSLTDARLLTSGDGYVEVAHEALLREWPRLQRWLEEDAAGRQLRLHLIGAARDWEARGREHGDLYRGARLAAALDWSADHTVELNALERDFVEQSRLASDAEAERQHRTNRRLRALLAGAGVLLVMVVAAGGYAVSQAEQARQSEQAARQAEDAARQSEQTARDSEQTARQAEQTALEAQQFARSRELAASAIAARDVDPTLSKLLAIEGASIAEPPVESVAALHRALDADRTIYRYEWPRAGRRVRRHGSRSFGALRCGQRRLPRNAPRLRRGHRSRRRPVTLVFRSVDARRRGGRRLLHSRRQPRCFRRLLRLGAASRSSTVDLGIHVRDALTGSEISRIDTGGCGAAVVAASNHTAIAFTSAAPSCSVSDASRRRDIVLESIDLATGHGPFDLGCLGKR